MVLIKKYFRPDNYCWAHANYNCEGCKKSLKEDSLKEETKGESMKDILTDMEKLRNEYTEKAAALIDEGNSREANSYLDKAIGVSEAINIIFRSDHIHEFV